MIFVETHLCRLRGIRFDLANYQVRVLRGTKTSQIYPGYSLSLFFFFLTPFPTFNIRYYFSCFLPMSSQLHTRGNEAGLFWENFTARSSLVHSRPITTVGPCGARSTPPPLANSRTTKLNKLSQMPLHRLRRHSTFAPIPSTAKYVQHRGKKIYVFSFGIYR